VRDAASARAAVVLGLIAGVALAVVPPARAVSRDVAKDVRSVYEGRSLRLRLDLRSAAHAVEPNVLTASGIGYGRERSTVLFHRFETVFLERITSEGGARLSLTIYRDADASRNLRITAVPPPVLGSPTGMQPMSTFARSDSTTVILELASSKKNPDAQRREITALMERLFYIDSEPTRAEIEAFVLENRDWPVARLSALTGLSQDEVRALVTGTPRPPESAPPH
jgi:hypothetical protein